MDYKTIVWLSPDRMGRLGKPPLALHSYRQEPVAICAVALHPSIANDHQRQYEAIRVWSHTTFIVIEAGET